MELSLRQKFTSCVLGALKFISKDTHNVVKLPDRRRIYDFISDIFSKIDPMIVFFLIFLS